MRKKQRRSRPYIKYITLGAHDEREAQFLDRSERYQPYLINTPILLRLLKLSISNSIFIALIFELYGHLN